MIIEIAGCSGAGKSTLAKNFIELLSIESHVLDMHNLKFYNNALEIFPLPLIRIFRICLIPFFLVVALMYNHLFLIISFRLLYTADCSTSIKVRHAYNVVRTLLLYQEAKLWHIFVPKMFILFDEGLFNTLQTILACDSKLCKEHNINTLVQCMPIPNVLVLVKADLETLLDRTMKREDKPLKTSSIDSNIAFVKNAYVLYEYLGLLIDSNNISNVVTLVTNATNFNLDAVELVELLIKRAECGKC